MFNTNYIFLRTYITNLDTSSTESALGVKSFSFQTCVSLIEVFRKQLKDRTNAYGSVHIWFIWTSNPRCQAWHLNNCRVLYFNHNFQFTQKCNATNLSHRYHLLCLTEVIILIPNEVGLRYLSALDHGHESQCLPCLNRIYFIFKNTLPHLRINFSCRYRGSPRGPLTFS